MRRIGALLIVLAAVCAAWLVPSSAGAALYAQCPPVYHDTGCQFLVTVTNGGETISEDPAQGPYEGSDDALVGVQNNSSSPISSIHLSAENELFGFESDGICSPGGAPIAPGCKVQKESTEHVKPTNPVGTECVYSGEERGGKPVAEEVIEYCAFNPPAGEPTGVTFPEGITPIGLAANGDQVSGYEGPTSWFSSIGPLGFNTTGAGTINFSPAIAPGGATYFSLESPPAGGFGSTSDADHDAPRRRADRRVDQRAAGPPGRSTRRRSAGPAPRSRRARSPTTSTATPPARTLVTAAGAGALAARHGGRLECGQPRAGRVLLAGQLRRRRQQQSDIEHLRLEVLTVQAPTTTTTIQTGGGVIGAVDPGAEGLGGHRHRAHRRHRGRERNRHGDVHALQGRRNAQTALTSSIATVTGGVALPSAPVKPGGGHLLLGGQIQRRRPRRAVCELLRQREADRLDESQPGAAERQEVLQQTRVRDPPALPQGRQDRLLEEFINGKLAKQGKLQQRRHVLRPDRPAQGGASKSSSSRSPPAAPATRTRARSTRA